jgi:hypothetical protein
MSDATTTLNARGILQLGRSAVLKQIARHNGVKNRP